MVADFFLIAGDQAMSPAQIPDRRDGHRMPESTSVGQMPARMAHNTNHTRGAFQ